MTIEHNSSRKMWQKPASRNAQSAENSFYQCFVDLFQNTQYTIIEKPQYFKNIYVGFDLTQEVVKEIYNPQQDIKQHGIVPDYAIKNNQTGKIIYIELKRQDGWVEGKKRSAGRGNAHERSCKYFTPGLIKTLREHGGINYPHLPFWSVFVGDITRDPCRVREISFWYGEHTAHLFFWRNTGCNNKLIEHFKNNIMPLLD